MWKVIRFETETGANKTTIFTRQAFKDAKAGLRIQMYRSILDNADMQLYPRRKEELEDLPA